MFGAIGNADQVALWVGELSDYKGTRSLFRAHPACPAEPLRLLQRGLDIGNAHVEQDAPFVALSTAHTAVVAGPVAGLLPSTNP